MSKGCLVLSLLMGLSVLLLGCSGPASAPTPAATTSVPATATPAPQATSAELSLPTLAVQPTPGDVTVAYKLIKLPEGDAVAAVNGVQISKASYEEELRRQLVPLTTQYRLDWNSPDVQAYMPEIQQSVLQQMIDFELLGQLARAEGVQITQAELDAEVSRAKQSTVDGQRFKSWEEVLQTNNLTEEQARKQIGDSLLVRRMAERHGGPTDELQAHASHILVDSEETGKEVLAKLQAGESFEELAKTYSADTGSKENGGDLGWFPRGVMVAEFEEMAFSMEIGSVSELVKTQFGYHIIKLAAREVRPLEGEMLQSRQQEAFTQWYQQERQRADVQEFLQLQPPS